MIYANQYLSIHLQNTTQYFLRQPQLFKLILLSRKYICILYLVFWYAHGLIIQHDSSNYNVVTVDLRNEINSCNIFNYQENFFKYHLNIIKRLNYDRHIDV